MKPPSIACQLYNPCYNPCANPCPPVNPCYNPCPPVNPCYNPCSNLAPNPSNPTHEQYQSLLNDIASLFTLSQNFLNTKYGENTVINDFYAPISGSNKAKQVAVTLYTSSGSFQILINSSSPNPDKPGSSISNTLENSAWEKNTITTANPDIPVPSPNVQLCLINNPQSIVVPGFSYNTTFQTSQYTVGTNIVNCSNSCIIGRLVVSLYQFPTCVNPCYIPCTMPCNNPCPY